MTLHGQVPQCDSIGAEVPNQQDDSLSPRNGVFKMMQALHSVATQHRIRPWTNQQKIVQSSEQVMGERVGGNSSGVLRSRAAGCGDPSCGVGLAIPRMELDDGVGQPADGV